LLCFSNSSGAKNVFGAVAGGASRNAPCAQLCDAQQCDMAGTDCSPTNERRTTPRLGEQSLRQSQQQQQQRDVTLATVHFIGRGLKMMRCCNRHETSFI